MGQQQRLKLQSLLESILGSSNVYFQPPPNVRMQYPAIVYSHDDTQTTFANNAPYNHTKRYQVMVIDRNPDSAIPDKIAMLPKCRFSRFYTANNLNHEVFNLFF